jgi:dTDP-4-dehydrorhamnose reductase
MTRVVVLGATGQVGRSLPQVIWPVGWQVVFRRRDQVDLARPDTISAEILAGRYDIVVNAAAWTDVEGAEDHEEEAMCINAKAPARLADLCARQGAALIHISTDYVFDGRSSGDHDESHPVRPLGAYARSKAAGEEGVRNALEHHVILRTAWVYSPFGRNFVKTMLDLGASRDALKVVGDQFGNPTSAQAIAHVIVSVAEQIVNGKTSWGTYHFAGQPWTTWFGLADVVFDAAAPIWGRRPSLAAIPASAWPSKVDRPANTRLDCSRIEREFGIVAPDWQADVSMLVANMLQAEVMESGSAR